MFKKLFDPTHREFKKCVKIAEKVVALENEYKLLSEEELKNKTIQFKDRYQNGEALDDLLVEAYATVREAATRVTNKTPFFVQIVGAIAIHRGNIAEMKTGEGKTLTSVMPAYLNALSGKAVHIVTVNEYLARREHDGEIGDIFRYLGLTVGLNLRELSPEEKKQEYLKDILYSTNSELGFDYLRDHMVTHKERMVQRGLSYAIIDEVDSILIDEARTPLIISGGAKNTGNLYVMADQFVKRLNDPDYEIDIEAKSIQLTQSGMTKAENYFKLGNLYDLQNVNIVHHINNALRANYIMQRDVEYMVSDDKILIIDSFTGRVLQGRQFSEGLHQALEAKEGVEIKKETITVATITYQNYFRMYEKLSGMTGTAKTEEEEFISIYNMYVVEIPTNRPVIRKDMPDFIYSKLEDKYAAIVKDVKERYEVGQPVLLGTISVDTSEVLSKLLKKHNIPHNVLNAKNHEREAEIIEKAGQKYSVTIATNMAGRGTDIKLGEGVKELGGLAVIGSERHESRRIDNQLRGRSGRQGDPGYSRFYLSADDELLMRFGGERFKQRLEFITTYQSKADKEANPSEVQPLESKMFSKFIENAQKRIEGSNYDSRKTVLKYDDVLRIQREIIYQQRTDILTLESILDIAKDMIELAIDAVISRHVFVTGREVVIEDEQIIKEINGNIFPPNTLNYNFLNNLDQDEIKEHLLKFAFNELERKQNTIPLEVFNEFLKVVVLRAIDTYWTKHIDKMSELRQGVTLQSYAQTNPLQIYQDEGFRLFEEMKVNIAVDATRYIIRAQIRENLEREEVNKNTTAVSGKEETTKKNPKKNVEPKVGRNDLCPCGSGKKYKYCCGAK